MTVTFGATGPDGGGAAGGDGGDNGDTVNNGGRRVLAAKTDSLSNVNNNNNNGPATTPAAAAADKTSALSVRRVLFGPIGPADRAETRAWLDRQLCAATAAYSRLWNFDFVNERPLPENPADRYVWERVLPPQRRDAAEQQSSQQHKQDWRASAADKHKQSKVTDYMGKTKKRPLGAAESLLSNKDAAATDEQSGVNNGKRTRRSVPAVI